MGENKTQPTKASVDDFVHSVEHPVRREDAIRLLAIYRELTGLPGEMWGDSIVGFGRYRYTNADGKEHSFFRAGFSPRKQNLSLYVGAGMHEDPGCLDKLGKYKTSKACLYINKLADVDEQVLKQVVSFDLSVMAERYPQ